MLFVVAEVNMPESKIDIFKQEYLNRLPRIVERVMGNEQFFNWTSHNTEEAFEIFCLEDLPEAINTRNIVELIEIEPMRKWIEMVTQEAANNARSANRRLTVDEIRDSVSLRRASIEMASSSPPYLPPEENMFIETPKNEKSLFKEELSALEKYIKKLQDLEKQGKLHKGTRFMGVQFKSNQVQKLEEAQKVLDSLRKTTNNPNSLGILKSKIEYSIAANSQATGSRLFHKSGEMDRILNNIIFEIDSKLSDLNESKPKP